MEDGKVLDIYRSVLSERCVVTDVLARWVASERGIMLFRLTFFVKKLEHRIDDGRISKQAMMAFSRGDM